MVTKIKSKSVTGVITFYRRSTHSNGNIELPFLSVVYVNTHEAIER